MFLAHAHNIRHAKYPDIELFTETFSMSILKQLLLCPGLQIANNFSKELTIIETMSYDS